MNSPSALFLFTHCRTLGHSTRIKNLATTFLKAFPHGKAKILNGGLELLNDLESNSISWINLPPYSPDDDLFGPLKPINIEDEDKRRAFLIDTINLMKPDILVTEFFPFARHELTEEFESMIYHAKKINPHCKIVSSVRDFIGQTSQLFPKIINDKLELFDQVWIHGDEDFLKIDTQTNTDKFKYTGYLTREAIVTKKTSNLTNKRVCLSFGGGKDSSLLINKIFNQIKLNDDIKHIDFIQGPYGFEPPEIDGKTIHIHRNIPDPRLIMARADICISMIGYNSFVEHLQLKCPTIFIPRLNESEQPARAKAWESIGGNILWDLDKQNINWDIRFPENFSINLRGNERMKSLWFDLFNNDYLS